MYKVEYEVRKNVSQDPKVKDIKTATGNESLYSSFDEVINKLAKANDILENAGIDFKIEEKTSKPPTVADPAQQLILNDAFKIVRDANRQRLTDAMNALRASIDKPESEKALLKKVQSETGMSLAQLLELAKKAQEAGLLTEEEEKAESED